MRPLVPALLQHTEPPAAMTRIAILLALTLVSLLLCGALERAQRIEPRNYFVWSSLARVYLDKKDYDNAESVALKSNSLARGNIYVELENWKIIAAARQAQGDAIGALQAQSKADEIQRGISGG